MEPSVLFNWVLGGGLLATLVAIITLKSTVKEAKGKAERAMAEAETVRIDNTEKATRILIENIVEPLKEELNATRKDLLATKREMARLRKAIDTANSCKHHADCPVLLGMREYAKAGADDHPDDHLHEPRQHRIRDPDDPDARSSHGAGQAAATSSAPI